MTSKLTFQLQLNTISQMLQILQFSIQNQRDHILLTFNHKTSLYSIVAWHPFNEIFKMKPHSLFCKTLTSEVCAVFIPFLWKRALPNKHGTLFCHYLADVSFVLQAQLTKIAFVVLFSNKLSCYKREKYRRQWQRRSFFYNFLQVVNYNFFTVIFVSVRVCLSEKKGMKFL